MTATTRSYPTLKTISAVVRVLAVLELVGSLGFAALVVAGAVMGGGGDAAPAGVVMAGGVAAGGAVSAALLYALGEVIMVLVGVGEDLGAIRERGER